MNGQKFEVNLKCQKSADILFVIIILDFGELTPYLSVLDFLKSLFHEIDFLT